MKDRLQLALLLVVLPTLAGAVALLVGTVREAVEAFAWVAGLWSAPMALLMLIVSLLTERKVRSVGGWVEGERQLRATFGVMYLRGDSTSGLLTLTDRRLRFSGHRFNAIPEVDYSFSLDRVEWVGLRRFGGVVPNSIGVRMRDGRELRFSVFRRRLWCAIIADALPHRPQST